jgi:hypothetical protein
MHAYMAVCGTKVLYEGDILFIVGRICTMGIIGRICRHDFLKMGIGMETGIVSKFQILGVVSKSRKKGSSQISNFRGRSKIANKGVVSKFQI